MTGDKRWLQELTNSKWKLSIAVNTGAYIKNCFTRFMYGFDPLDNYYYAKSTAKLENRINNERTLEDILNTAYWFSGYGRYKTICPIQHRHEFKKLTKIVEECDPEIIVEIGTYQGGAFYVWTRYLDSVKIAVSVDVDYKNRRRFYEEFSNDKELHFLERNSQNQETVKLLHSKIKGADVDFLFIDGDHSYEGVKKDFELYSTLMSQGGIIGFHDISSEVFGVKKFWNEIKDDYDTEEIILKTNYDAGAHIQENLKKATISDAGIGIVYLD